MLRAYLAQTFCVVYNPTLEAPISPLIGTHSHLPSRTSAIMSAIKRLLSGHHKLHKHNSLPQPPSTDLRIDYLDLERVNRHERCRSKPTTPISASTPTYKTGVAISGSPISQSPTSSSSSVKSNPHHGRSRSRVRAKHERAKSLDVRATKSRLESLERATHRQDSYNSASPLSSNAAARLLTIIGLIRTHSRGTTANFP